MKAALLDVNVLVALFDPAHPNHEDAHAWFGAERKGGWATCPITIAGCIRVLSNPAYPSFNVTPAEVISRLRKVCADAAHQFWSDDVSLLDARLVHPHHIAGHQKITDAQLLALAVQHKGKLATFDRGIPLKAIAGASSDHVLLLG